MTDQQYAYPFDPTGESSDNLIVKESHVINPPDYTDFYFVVPTVAPFFEHNLKVQHWPSGRILINGVDFILSYKFLGASRATAKPVYGAISILDRVLSGVLEVTYQTLGGPWTIDENKAAELLSNVANNPRRTTWEQVVELPHAFPVIDHEWDLVDMVGASELKDALDRITDALYDQIGTSAPGENHATNKDNPHEVTKAQVGLGSVDNFATASFTEATDPAVTNRFMTPQRVAQLIDVYIGNRVDGHIARTDNPHGVTKTQIGLSNVPNYRMADATESIDPAVDNRFTTPKSVHEAIQAVAIGALDDHKADDDNPHGVTKAQVGLDRVENYGIASDSVARDGSSQIHYLTPHGAMQLILAKVGDGVGDHVADRDNPHQVTKAQVGLGNVPNYTMATASSAVEGTAQSEFMSPYLTRLLIESLVNDSNDALVDLVSDHTADFTNPHQVTKTQVGLGNVQDFGVATSAQSIEGTRADLYMTPTGASALVEDRLSTAFDGFVAEDSNRLEGLSLEQVTELITGTVSIYITQLRDDVATLNTTINGNHQDFTEHTADTNNPHNVTKAQVGLDQVANFAPASVLDAEDDANESKYMTPARSFEVARSVFDTGMTDVVTPALQDIQDSIAQTNTTITTHAARTDNPHNVTADQVGLGSVDNYPTADNSEAMDPLQAERFMTPQRVHEVVDAKAVGRLDGLDTLVGNLQSQLNGHAARTDNPHQVTAAQVGAITQAEVLQLVDGKLNAADGVAYDSERFGGVTYDEYGQQVDQKISQNINVILPEIRNKYYFQENAGTDPVFRKVAEAQFLESEWGVYASTPEYRPTTFLVSTEISGNVVLQQVSIAAGLDGSWDIAETSISTEVESMFYLLIDPATWKIEVWQRVPVGTSLTTLTVQSMGSKFVMLDGSETVSVEHAGAVYSPNRSVGFSYRLAATIEEEFGLLAQELENL